MEDAIKRALTSQYKPAPFVLHQPIPPPIRFADLNTPRRLLIPAVRLPDHAPRVSSASIATALDDLVTEHATRSPRSKHTPSKLTRTIKTPPQTISRAGTLIDPSASSATFASHAHKPSQEDLHAAYVPVPGRPPWVQDFLGHFEIVQDTAVLRGFQLYAVEKW